MVEAGGWKIEDHLGYKSNFRFRLNKLAGFYLKIKLKSKQTNKPRGWKLGSIGTHLRSHTLEVEAEAGGSLNSRPVCSTE